MPTITALVEHELRELVGLGEAELGMVEAVYPLISARAGSMPPIQRIDVPEANGEIDIKSAYLPGYDGIAVKISAGFFDNPNKGLPSLGGLMLLFDSATGIPQAALFDNGYLTDVRTALAGAVAARHLARSDAAVVGLIGAGVQARMQLDALRLVRPIERALVWARRPEAARRFAEEVGASLDLPIEPVADPSDTVVAGGILVTATPATVPLIDAPSLAPGLHITAVGSDAEHKRELTVAAIKASDRFVCDSRPQSARLGELHSVVEVGGAGSAAWAVELGEVIGGKVPGRTSDDEITICDLTGTGAQDTAIASYAVAQARATGRGTVIEC